MQSTASARAASVHADLPLVWTFDGPFATCLARHGGHVAARDRAGRRRGGDHRADRAFAAGARARVEAGDAIQPAWGRFLESLTRRYGLPAAARVRHHRTTRAACHVGRCLSELRSMSLKSWLLHKVHGLTTRVDLPRNAVLRSARAGNRPGVAAIGRALGAPQRRHFAHTVGARRAAPRSLRAADRGDSRRAASISSRATCACTSRSPSATVTSDVDRSERRSAPRKTICCVASSTNSSRSRSSTISRRK